MRVGVLGARGRMGQTVVEAITGAPDLELACALDLGDPLAQVIESGTRVLVDFTTPQAVLDNITFAVEHDIVCVVGTSGFTPDRIEQVRHLVDAHSGSSVLIAPNFGIGAVLMMRFARMAAPYFDSVEIVEMHHPGKVDAPSGTALHTAQLIAQAREGRTGAPDATRVEDRDARGRPVHGVPIHSVRLQGLVAHQEVLFGSAGETLTIRHDSLDRGSFMSGVLLAIRDMSGRTGLVVGLENLLDL
ncbi:MAG: 4-hydroxy-tetrahydrodipicolinate reductase [Actinobacteria bacterium]|nr:4-hydroxy-tetrahydrodipicolinate reductase [Actinomycetota bacterium]